METLKDSHIKKSYPLGVDKDFKRKTVDTLFITHPACRLHMMHRWHPESPKRLDAISDRLVASGVSDYVNHMEAPKASVLDLSRVHRVSYIDFIRENTPIEGYFNVDTEETCLNPHTYTAALHAAGSGILAVDQLMAKKAKNAFCSVRPPGHHAEPDRSTGFCFFNNVAIAAAYAIEKYGLKRIAIVDFDVHHGNGTEKIFEDHPFVRMYSFFQHPLFPHSGTENVAKNMLNTPVPAFTGMAQVERIVTEHWLPDMHAYQPELLLISAGFDAHREDEMGQMDLVEKDFVWMTEQLMQVADTYCEGRVISFLEGGYALSALGRSAVEHIKTLARV